jgi:hypothetical protein
VKLFGLLGHLLEERSRDLLPIPLSRKLDGSPSGIDQPGDNVETAWWRVHKPIGYQRHPE